MGIRCVSVYQTVYQTVYQMLAFRMQQGVPISLTTGAFVAAVTYGVLCVIACLDSAFSTLALF